jgi:tripartite ATP-independent transporter DctM subunit
MEWWLALLLIFSGLMVMMATGMHIAFCFLLVCMIGVYILWGGIAGLELFAISLYTSVASFILLPMPLFILMGEVVFHSGIAPNMIDALDKWMGRLPGRLGLLSIASGTVLSTLSGSSMATIAILGSTLAPEMEKRGYKTQMTIGPILGSSGLAMMIPPSGLAVLLASLGKFSIGGFLMAIIMPGLLMAILYSAYVIIRCHIQPSIAPSYDVPSYPLSEKLSATVRYILPVGFIIFLVIGVILLGIATPTEAAATGCIGAFLLTAAYRKLNGSMLKKTMKSSLRIIGMIFLIIAASTGFSQILAFSGASSGLIAFATNLPLHPMLVVIGTQIVGIILGMFISPGPIMMICAPIFFPLIQALGYDPLWYGATFLLITEMAPTTPPFGLSLFVMKGVSPSHVSMKDIIESAFPFLLCDTLAIILIMIFPQIALWLPSVMH